MPLLPSTPSTCPPPDDADIARGLLLRAELLRECPAASRDPLALSELVAAVCTFVRAAKALGQSPERVLASVKEQVSAVTDRWLRYRDFGHLAERLAGRCVEAYYRDGALSA
jgi:hypothetical protein